jgi:ABC-2 type transport system permease protein
MIRTMPIEALTLRGLVDRRRFWLMVLLAAVPVLIALIGRAFGEGMRGEDIFDPLVVSTVLPLVALVFGTAALGSEMDDGSIVYLLAKPVRRSRIVLGKGVTATGLTAVLVVPATVLTGFIAGTGRGEAGEATLAYAIAVAVGAAAYTMAFLALSAFTSRALAIGLAYILLWEGVLAGLFEGTKTFSIRQATIGLAAQLQEAISGVAAPEGAASSAVVVLAVVIVGAFALAAWRLSRFQLSGAD